MFVHKNHAAGGENGSIMVGMFVFLCLASQKPSEREFFVPAGTDLAVKLLILVVSHCLSVGYFCPFRFFNWRGTKLKLLHT